MGGILETFVKPLERKLIKFFGGQLILIFHAYEE